MKNILSKLTTALNRRTDMPFDLEGRFALTLKSFSDAEKQVFFVAMGILVGTTIIILMTVNRAFIVEVPARGGTLVEGVQNTPAHINPLLATGEVGSEADRDLVALIYSGLLRVNEHSEHIPDLAESYEVSKDGLSYTFILREDLVWHDGEKITADDVVFTVKTAQDGRFKSAKRASWDGVGVEKVDERTVRFTLNKPYAPFLENATMGILPEHIWKTIDFNRFDTNIYNRKPVGSGPYKLASIETTTKDGDTIPVSYTLKAFRSFALGRPFIDTIKVNFYHNEDDLVSAFITGEVDAINSITPNRAKVLSGKGFRILHAPLPRVLAVFFNQNENAIFADSSVREALSTAIPRENIVDESIAGYGTELDGALPPETLGYSEYAPKLPPEERVDRARAILKKGGWSFATSTTSEVGTWTKKVKKETLSLQFSLATSDADELKVVAQNLKDTWEKVGIPTTVKIFAIGDLKETIVRPRKFDALFFGQVLGREGDPFPFWHSSQRLDPGLNVAGYANATADKLLSDARAETNNEKRAKLYRSFQSEIAKDVPAAFLYAPEFIYALQEKVQGVSLGLVTIPAERFRMAHTWYIYTDGVWKGLDRK